MMKNMPEVERFQGTLLGLAAGDAVGTTVEFSPRGTFVPLTDMVGGGPFGLKPGQWTDDTSMALCLATSLLECNTFDAQDQMGRYCRWAETGYLSCIPGPAFDIGGTVASALQKFKNTGEPLAGSSNPYSAGNGCIMRLAPIPMFYFPHLDKVEEYSAKSSQTTHSARESIDACRLFGRMICRALLGQSREEIALGDSKTLRGAPSIVEIARGSYLQKKEMDITGSGYVVQSLEAAMWCFMKTDSYREAILAAANLGDDADTTAAICGQVAGAYYSVSGIPSDWLDKLAMRKEITQIADQLHARQMGTDS